MNDVNTATAAPRFSMRDRMAMYNDNALKIGLFGSNCSSGRAVTLVPERWTGNWEDNLALAKMSDAAGIEFMLPVGRWKGYGGDTDYMGTSLETITWATGLLAHTKRLIVFGTVHAPLFHPLIAAKQFVTADHVSEGRFGLNIVVGWNEDEFQMFGVTQRDHEAALRLRPGMDRRGEDGVGPAGRFRIRGPVHQAQERARQAQAVRRRAPADHERRRLDDRPRLRDPQLRRLLHPGRPHLDGHDRRQGEGGQGRGAAQGRELDVYAVGVVTCRPTQKEAEEYYHYATIENGDWSAVDGILGKKNISPRPSARRSSSASATITPTAWAAC